MRGTLAKVLGLETHSDLESETMDTEMGWKGGAESIDGRRKNANNSKVQKSALKEVFF